MIRTTLLQDKALIDLGLCEVIYRAMYQNKGELGYTSKGHRQYDINIASDTGNYDVRDIVLIHEIGHVYYGHMQVNHSKEMLKIKEICEKLGVPFSTVFQYGGPMRFLNVAMDLEVNSKLLTNGNIKAMTNFGAEPVTCDNMGVEVADSFRDYYEPLLKKAAENSNGGDNNMPDLKNSFGEDLPGFGSGSGDGDGDGSNDGDGEEIQLPQEIMDALLEEGYFGGDQKSGRDDKTGNGTVEEAAGEIGQDEEKRKEADDERTALNNGILNHKKSHGIGKSGNTCGKVEVSENSSATITKFLKSIINHSMKYQHNYLKHYNRGTRRNPDGILYDSTKRRVVRDNKKLGILVDVSGSMNTESIVNAISSLKESLRSLNPESEFATWNTHLSESFPITNLPDSVEIGGGTDMAAGLKYFTDKDFTDVVIYSDFETDMDDLNKLAIENPSVKLYGICVGTYMSNRRDFQDYVAKNKKMIFVE